MSDKVCPLRHQRSLSTRTVVSAIAGTRRPNVPDPERHKPGWHWTSAEGIPCLGANLRRQGMEEEAPGPGMACAPVQGLIGFSVLQIEPWEIEAFL